MAEEIANPNIDHFDDPSGRHHWFRRSRMLSDGTMPVGLIARASVKKRRLERELRRERRLLRRESAAPLPGAAPLLPAAAPQQPTAAQQPEATPFAPAPPSATGTNWSLLGPDQVAGGSGGAQMVTVSGRVTALAVSSGGSRIYLGSANGGVWYSGDGGATWTSLDQFSTMSATETVDVEADSLSVGALAVIFGAAASSAGGVGAFADTIYIGTGEPNGNLDAYYGVGIKVSTDGGLSFHLEATNLTSSEVYQIVIDPADPTIVFAATTTGIYRRPAGPDFSSWTHVTDPDSALAGSPVADLVVAGSGETRTYYAATVDKVWASIDIFKKPDGSATWTVVNGIANPNPNPSNNPLRKSLAVGENDKSVVYCLVQGQGGAGQADFSLFRLDSTTSGAFAAVTVPATVGLFSGFGWYDIVVAADPGNANTIYLLGGATLESNAWALAMYKGTLGASPGGYSFTSGPTWIGTGVHPDGHVLAFATNADGSHDGTNVWVGCDGGVFQSASGGSAGSFVSKNVGLSTTQITYFSLRADTADELYAGCQDNGTLHYTASGTPPWFQSGGGDGGGVAINPDPANTSQIIRQYTWGSLEVSADNGASWGAAAFPTSSIDWGQMRSGLDAYPEYNSGPFYGPVCAIRSGSQSLVAFGTNRLWLRPDWSAAWVTLPTNTNPYANTPANLTQDLLDTTNARANVNAIAFGSPTMILAATSGGNANGKVWRFDQQSGGTWTVTAQPAVGLPAPSRVFVTALVVEDPVRGSFYATLGSAGGEHVLYFDGTQWQSAGLSSSTLDIPVHAIVLHPADSNTVYIGTDVGVWKGVKSGGAAPSSSSSSSDSSSSDSSSSDSSSSTSATLSWTWTPFSDGLPEASVQDLAIQATTQKLRAATHGRAVWEIPIDWPGSSSSDSSSSDSSSSDSSSSDSSSSDSSSSDSSSSDSSSSDSSSSDSSSSDSSSSDSSSSDSSSSDSISSDSSSSDSSSSDSGDSSSSDSGDSSSSDSGDSSSDSGDSSSSDSGDSSSDSGDSSSSDSGDSSSDSGDSSSSDSGDSSSDSGDSSSSDSGDSSSSDDSSDSSSSDDSGDSSSSDDSGGSPAPARATAAAPTPKRRRFFWQPR